MRAGLRSDLNKRALIQAVFWASSSVTGRAGPMALATPVCSALYSKLAIRPGPTHKAFESFRFFSKWRWLPGVQGSGKDARPGMCPLQGISWSVGAGSFPAWFPVLSHLVFASG